MDYKEVRIGNWIDEQGLHLQVGMINSEVLKSAEPIPLTDDWLEKLGLIKKNITEDMPEGLKQPDIDEDGSIWYHWVQGLFNLEVQSNGEIWFEVYSHYKHVKYVHELQNLYYSLCGEELVLK
jgi:hypothetical protein